MYKYMLQVICEYSNDSAISLQYLQTFKAFEKLNTWLKIGKLHIELNAYG